MKKILGSILAVAIMSVGLSANAESQLRQLDYSNELPVLSGLKNYPTVSEVKALNSKVIVEKTTNEDNYKKVDLFDVNKDGVIVLSEVIDMVNANFEAPDYTSLDDLTQEDIEQISLLLNNLENYVHLVKKS